MKENIIHRSTWSEWVESIRVLRCVKDVGIANVRLQMRFQFRKLLQQRCVIYSWNTLPIRYFMVEPSGVPWTPIWCIQTSNTFVTYASLYDMRNSYYPRRTRFYWLFKAFYDIKEIDLSKRAKYIFSYLFHSFTY